MNSKKLFALLFTIIILLILGNSSKATHIRAGEITMQRVNCQSKTFIIYITAYVDVHGGQVEFGNGVLDFGDGSEKITDIRNDARITIIKDEEQIQGGNGVAVTKFMVKHTFSGNGIYFVSYQESNRNDGIINIYNSVENPFYVETMVRLDGTLGCNMFLPEMLIPPIDYGCSGVTFFHNPGAFDKDGDSLSFEFLIPRKAKNTFVDSYQQINDLAFNGSQEGTSSLPATLSIDPITGDLKWNSPGIAGEYNVAFRINEYRKLQGKYFLIGSVVRDMQIIVTDCNNNRPTLSIPDDICIEAGSTLNFDVSAADKDGDDVKIEVFSIALTLGSSSATYSPFPSIFQPQEATVNFNWATVCSQVREQPYLVNFKVTDQPTQGVPLVEFKTVSITVVAPAPQNLQSSINPDRSVSLTWDNYSCANAEKMQIWRRIDSYPLSLDLCETGIPNYAHYELINEVEASTTNYTDDNNGKKLNFSANYCYRLVAIFPSPTNGESYVSSEVCAIIKADAPVITHISVNKTDQEEGEIKISWRKPFDINQLVFPPPYFYELWRGTGFEGDTDIKIMNISTDTTFIDTEINTVKTPFHYIVKLFDGTENLINSTSASSVFSSPTPLNRAIELSWLANVPWSNNTFEFPYHYIYRDRVDANDPSKLILIDSVNVNQKNFFYQDNGSFNGQALNDELLYCYTIETLGSYGNPKIDAPQRNLSQIICLQPNDTILPCRPNLTLRTPNCFDFLENKSCEFNSYFNILSWSKLIPNNTEICDLNDDIIGYNIYFAGAEQNFTNFTKIDFVQDTFYLHSNLPSFAGCYYITGIDRSNNESAPSNIICNDNCVKYVFPNIFTPNNDSKNDTFRPSSLFSSYENKECPRFINAVKFKVFNRWGEMVYRYESGGENSIFINWDGKDTKGNLLPSGVYYYFADAYFDLRDPNERNKQLKGWVQILY